MEPKVKREQSGRNGMIDLHGHILPGMDDGAKELREAGKTLAMQNTSSVDGLL